MARIKQTTNKKTVKATANGGQEYEVEFDLSGEVISVATMFRRTCDYRTQRRQIYRRGQIKKMSLISACAVRAAIKVLDEKITQAGTKP